VVSLLNEVFSKFDDLADRFGLEKIKTIGDAYMVVGGLPTPREDHAHAVADFAIEMLRVVEELELPDGTRIAVRAGINTGPVVAGVIGHRKFIYDLWGDAVNVASRMESHGEPGAIQVTQATYDRLREAFDLSPRGMIAVKGKGEMSTYFLRGRRGPPGPHEPREADAPPRSEPGP
jgi:class 3 adenylate cyclase